jgi:hypothetical protein
MATPTEGSVTTKDKVQINWKAMATLTETGGTNSISSYNLEIYDTS